MIFVLFFAIGCIWGFGYILSAIINALSNKKADDKSSVIGGIIVLDIVILLFSAPFGAAGIVIGLLICFLADSHICNGANQTSTKEGREEIKKKTEAQDKYDNDWGIISWEDKDK